MRQLSLNCEILLGELRFKPLDAISIGPVFVEDLGGRPLSRSGRILIDDEMKVIVSIVS